MIEPRLLHVLQHALGLDQYGQGRTYRNFFCAGEADEVLCEQLVVMGYMRRHRTTELYPYANFSVTDEGRKAVRDHSPAQPKLTRSQRRYRRFLDADSDLSFIEWLKHYDGRRM